MRYLVRIALSLLFAIMPAGAVAASSASPVHVWEKQEITLTAAQAFLKPHTDVTAGVDLAGTPSDSGLTGKTGSFAAVQWTDAEKEQNPLRRGFIQATANGHALQYADGTPYLIKGDTWWSLGTFHFPWFDDDKPRAIGPDAGIKDYVRLRKSQGYNLVAMLLRFPD